MDTVVVVTPSAPRESDVVRALRPSGLRVRCRRMDDEPDAVLADRPDVVVVDVPDSHRVSPLVEPFLGLPGLESLSVMAVVGPPSFSEAMGIALLRDVVLRPLREEELLTRVRRPLQTIVRDSDDRIRVGGLVIDVRGYEVTVDGERVDLTYQEFELLAFLASHPDTAFTRAQLLARVWGYDYFGGSRTVDIHVRRIRAKLGNPYAACVVTIRNVGYKWVMDPVTR